MSVTYRPITFTTREQEYHLETAAHYTGSGGWRADAEALAAYDGDLNSSDVRLRGVFVLQNFDALGADMHFALAPGRKNTHRLITSLLKFAFHPNTKNLPALRAFIPAQNVETQMAALHLGFTFSAKIPAGIASVDEVVLMVLKREDCRWTLPVMRGAN